MTDSFIHSTLRSAPSRGKLALADSEALPTGLTTWGALNACKGWGLIAMRLKEMFLTFPPNLWEKMAKPSHMPKKRLFPYENLLFQ